MTAPSDRRDAASTSAPPPPAATELSLDEAVRYAIGLQRNGARAASMALDAAYGLGAGAFERYAEEIEAVTAEQVLEAARATIDFERSALAVVGP